MKPHVCGLLTLLPFLLGACFESDHLIYVQDSNFGVDASISTEGTQKMQLGFTRDMFAIVPKKSGNDEVMSALSYSYYSYQFPANFVFNNFIATGGSAVLLRDDSTTMGKIRDAIFHEDESQSKVEK